MEIYILVWVLFAILECTISLNMFHKSYLRRVNGDLTMNVLEKPFSRSFIRSQANILCKSSHRQKVSNNADPGVSLTKYMRLPVDQYVCVKIPLSAKLERKADNTFELTVPDLTFFNLKVSPLVIAEVSQTETSVIIESSQVFLRGSPYVESLNGCYEIRVRTEFGWEDGASCGPNVIISKSKIKVAVNPPSPFKYLPHSALEATGMAVMQFALKQIESAFLRALAKDYENWALDGNYRISRACEDMCNLDDEVVMFE
jgi:hypothetical protein